MICLTTSNDPQTLGASTSVIDRYSKEIVKSGTCLAWRDLFIKFSKGKHTRKLSRKYFNANFNCL